MSTHEAVLLWTYVAAVGILLSVYLSYQALRDLWALRGTKNGRRLRVLGRLSQESLRLLVHSAFFFIGVRALERAGAAPADVTVYVLIGGNVCFILNSLIAVYVMRRAEFPPPSSLTPEQMAARAEEAARLLLSEAHGAAQELLDLAAVAASERQRVEASRMSVAIERTADADERNADASERTADATERLAEQEEASK